MAVGGASSGKGGAIRAGRAVVEAFLDDAGFKAQLNNMKRRVMGFGKSLMAGGGMLVGLGASVLGPMGAAFKSAVSHFDKFGKAADKTGATTESLSNLAYAARQTDASLEDVVNSTKFLQKTMLAAAAGSEEAQEALAAIGLTAEDLKGKDLFDQFKMIANGLKGVDAESRRPILEKIMGRGAGSLLSMLKDGASGLDKFRERNRALRGEVSGDTADKADRIGDAFSDMWEAIENSMMSVGTAFFGSVDNIEQFANTIIEVTGAVTDFIRNNRELVMGIAAGAAVVAALGVAFIAIGGTIAATAFAIGGFVSAISAIGAALPVIIAVGAIIGAISFQAMMEGTDSVTKGFEQLWAVIKATFSGVGSILGKAGKGIADALALGDLKGAWEVVTLAMEAIWKRMIANVNVMFQMFLAKIKSGFAVIKADLAKMAPMADSAEIDRRLERELRRIEHDRRSSVRDMDLAARMAEGRLGGRVAELAELRREKEVMEGFRESFGRGDFAATKAAAGFRDSAKTSVASAQQFGAGSLQQALGLGPGVRESDETKELKKHTEELKEIRKGVGALALEWGT